jgi:5-methylcytosine-specific restriction endonuclease McrA
MSKRYWVRYRPAFKYDWANIQAYYDEGHSFRECKARFGFSNRSWHKARLRGDLTSIRPASKPLGTLLTEGKHRSSIKRRLLKEGILKNECCRCGITTWREKRLSIQIDHINGINNDYRLENLRMLCPNCHSLTDTHGGKNRRRKIA